MNKLKTLAVLTLSIATLGTVYAAPEITTDTTTEAVPARLALDRIIAVVNNDVITERELQERTHAVAINLRRQNIQLPEMDKLRRQVLERLISEKTIMQRARETGI
ncbi:secreted protein containing SurA, partial [gut metagenome]